VNACTTPNGRVEIQFIRQTQSDQGETCDLALVLEQGTAATLAAALAEYAHGRRLRNDSRVPKDGAERHGFSVVSDADPGL